MDFAQRQQTNFPLGCFVFFLTHLSADAQRNEFFPAESAPAALVGTARVAVGGAAAFFPAESAPAALVGAAFLAGGGAAAVGGSVV